MIKSRRMREACHVTAWGEQEIYTTFWLENLKQSDDLRDPGVSRRIILKWMLVK
jgi:hypothetical protein